MALPKKQRLTDSDQIQHLFRGGKNVRGTFLSMRSARTASEEQKSVVVISTKVAPNASTRNRLRRKVSEGMRTLITRTIPGYHLVITILSPHLPESQAIQDELLSLLVKSDILNR